MPRLLLCLLPLILTFTSVANENLSWVGNPRETPDQEPDVLVWTAWTGPSLDWLEDQLGTYGKIGGLSIAVGQFTLGELRKEAVQAADDARIADVLVGVPHDQLAELVAAGLLADVGAYATAEYLADLPDQASGAFVHDSVLLGLPLTLEGPALLVNTALVPDLPLSYAEFIENARTLQRRPGSDGFRFDFGNIYFSWAWLGSHGASLLPAGQTTDIPGLAGPAGLAGAQALQDLRFEFALIPQNTSYESARDAFASGTLGYIYDGPWAVAGYFAAGVPLTVMPVPAIEPGRAVAGLMTVQGVLVTSGSPSHTAAANTAKWLVRSAAQRELAANAGRIPASIQAVDALASDEILHGFGVALRNAVAVPTDARMARAWPALGRFLQRLDAAPLSAEQILDLLRESVEEIQGN